jgi:hypothetical protein
MMTVGAFKFVYFQKKGSFYCEKKSEAMKVHAFKCMYLQRKRFFPAH